MDARVNDFLNEINEIAPLNENTKNENVWEKCYDEDSGYYYYWNTKTNEVTWDMPLDYRSSNKTRNKKSSNLYIPPRTAPLFPSTSNLVPPVSDAIKIYKIGECTDSISSSHVINKGEEVNSCKQDKQANFSKPSKPAFAVEEKVVLISSYGGDSDSEDETQSKETNMVNGSSLNQNSDDEDDFDILSKIQKKASELRKTGGEIKSPKEQSVASKISETKEISGFSLVAGYSDSEEEPENETSKTVFPLVPSPPKENTFSHSTLFPVVKPIDVKDFEEPLKNDETEFYSKAFQRKRRIGVALVNTGKKTRTDDDNERKGLGFSTENTEDNNSANNLGNTYSGFKSGGVMFIKSDVLNPSNSVAQAISTTENSDEKKISKEIEETYTTLKEKLGFLSEGKEQVSPVQVMMIQLETLNTALQSGNLKQNYLKAWLEETCSDLIKLEQETTPEGWLLQWDRTHKRYYYQNAATGESQWEYPQADVTGCDEAMDICTTPPPSGAETTIHMSPPLPPVIGSPSPPPPPKISDSKTNMKRKTNIPLPPEPKESISAVNNSTEEYDSNGEPLPPGVDAPDANIKDVKDDMNDVLNSFYSDLAAIENSNSPPVPIKEDTKSEVSIDSVQEQIKKKKKPKVKLAQGIAMKKKGVSKLVEKWNNVQMSYND